MRWIIDPRLMCNMQVFDGYFVKYFASVVALLVYAAPIYFKEPAQRGSRDDITQDYIRSMRLLQNTSKGVGDLVLVYKRITGLAGHTSRVAELLEQVCNLTYHIPLHTHSSTQLSILCKYTHGCGVSPGEKAVAVLIPGKSGIVLRQDSAPGSENLSSEASCAIIFASCVANLLGCLLHL